MVDTRFVSMYQKAPDIYPRAVKGWFAAWRWAMVWLTQLFFYGLPYNPVWWMVMAAILAGAAIVPVFCARAVEWVMDGYREDRQG